MFMRCEGKAVACLGALLLTGVSGCSLVLDFDKPIEASDIDAAIPDGNDTDADLSDAAPDATSAVANCDSLEPNESLGAAIAITPMTLEAAICPDSDVDFYEFSLLADSNLSVALSFDNGDGGDLDLRLYNPAGAIEAASTGTGATEQIDRGALPVGTYRIEVYSDAMNTTKDYTLSLDVVIATAP